MGADATINAQREDLLKQLRQLNRGQGVDLVIVATGAKSANISALQFIRPISRISKL